MRRFEMHRRVDVSGVSGVGHIADGVTFEDGTTVTHWRGEHPSTVVWATFDDAVDVHGHAGATEFVWLDA